MKIDSKDKKILIFSDPHQEIDKVDDIIKHEAADINICLGDWFDSFYKDYDSDYKATADYLLKYLDTRNSHTCFGNHDVHYLFNSDVAKCSGYEDRKYFAIDDVIGRYRKSVQDYFKWYFVIDDYLCTHAGIHPNYIPSTAKNNDDIINYIDSECERATLAARTNDYHWFFKAGRARGGFARYGGIVWLDFDNEFEPIEDLKQIVGHTFRRSRGIEQHHTEGFSDLTEANNLCIDCNVNQWLTITNGKMEIKSYKDL